MAPVKISCTITLVNADSWLITEYNFLPIIHTSWIFSFDPLEPLCVSAGFCLTFIYVNPISFWRILTIQVTTICFSFIYSFFTFSIFREYCCEFSDRVFSWSSCMFSFLTTPFFLKYLYQCLGTRSWREQAEFLSHSIVNCILQWILQLIPLIIWQFFCRSFVCPTSCWRLEEFNCRPMCIHWLLLVSVLWMKITKSFLNFFSEIELLHIFPWVALKKNFHLVWII